MWTEMKIDTNLVCADEAYLDLILDFKSNEHPIVCQLGGCNPASLARAAKVCEERGFDAINLNCGCPSKYSGLQVRGASLMKCPERVRDCVKCMTDAVSIPVTVKCRLGVDDLDTPEFTAHFVRTVAEGGVRHFIVHARKAWLEGLLAKDNREIPPLMYDRVMQLCEEFPDL